MHDRSPLIIWDFFFEMRWGLRLDTLCGTSMRTAEQCLISTARVVCVWPLRSSSRRVHLRGGPSRLRRATLMWDFNEAPFGLEAEATGETAAFQLGNQNTWIVHCCIWRRVLRLLGSPTFSRTVSQLGVFSHLDVPTYHKKE